MAQNLISSFNFGHQSIVEAISQVQMVSRSHMQARSKLRELNQALLAHLGRQDRKLNEQLIRISAGDRESQKILEFLSLDLKDIKVKYLVFFDKHTGETGQPPASNFAKDFSDFTELVLARIKMEEEYLFPLLRKIEDA